MLRSVAGLELPDRILIVEDDDTIRLLLERALGKKRLTFAGDGLAGLEALHREHPDIAILDLELPDLDGSTFVSEVRKTSFGACIPMLVLAPAGEESRLAACFEAGADDFIVRPLSVSELRVRVSKLTMARRIAREAHPLTQLPTGPVIRARIADRLASGDPFAIAYIDIDHFKTFNESRGFDVGDEVLRSVAAILSEIGDADRAGVFVGHVGDDDFVALLPAREGVVERFAEQVHGAFSAQIRQYFTDREIEEGHVELVNRRAEVEHAPLPSISIAVVTTERPGLDDVRKIEHVGDEIAKVAKAQPGNSLFVERRKNSPA
jgi:diguanylate cyclase (GGDEF)-like protein